MTPAARRWSGHSAELLTLAGQGLPRLTRLLPNWLRACSWPELVAECRSQQLLPCLADAVAEGARELDDDERTLLQTELVRELAAVVLLERDLLLIASVLEHEGVPYRVLKGIANAHLDYADPSLRLFGDVDVIVAADHMELAKVALEARGFARLRPERRRGFDARFEKSIMLFSPSTGNELDLHRAFLSGPFGHCMDPIELFETAEHFALGGRSLPALAREERFIHACIAATVSDAIPRVRPARDVVQLLLHPALDHDRTLDLAHRWGMAVLVARAIDQSVEGLGIGAGPHPLVAWAVSYRPYRDETRRLNCYVGASSSYVRRVAASLRELPGVRVRLAYARAMMLPAPDAVDTPLADKVRRAASTFVDR